MSLAGSICYNQSYYSSSVPKLNWSKHTSISSSKRSPVSCNISIREANPSCCAPKMIKRRIFGHNLRTWSKVSAICGTVTTTVASEFCNWRAISSQVYTGFTVVTGIPMPEAPSKTIGVSGRLGRTNPNTSPRLNPCRISALPKRRIRSINFP